MDGNKKIHICITFLNGIQVTQKRKFSGFDDIFQWFFGCVPLPPFNSHPQFWYMKCFEMVHVWAKFYLCPTCSFRVSKFQMFSYQLKVQFQAISRRFAECNRTNCRQIRLKLCPLMHCKVLQQACDGFYFILGKHLKLSQKPDFLPHFERFFVYNLLCPMSYTPIFCQTKGLIKVHNRGKFHQVINFQFIDLSQLQVFKLQTYNFWLLLGIFWP